MLNLKACILALSVLSFFVVEGDAQSSDLAALAAMYPTCSLNCMAELIPQSSCISVSGLNQTCVCLDAALNQQITLCASKSCDVRELLTTKNASMTACGGEIRDHSSEITIIGLTLGAVAYAVFLLRVFARLFTLQKRLFSDDYVMTAMVIFTIPPTVLAPLLAANGLGKDMWTLPFQNIANVLEFFLIGEICYIAALALNKISILCFFLRIFPDKQLRMKIYVTMGLCTAYGIAFFFATLFQCSPVSYMWWQWDDNRQGKCNNFHLQGWLAAIINIILDLLVMALPMSSLFKMNMSKRKKASVLVMFLTGLFVTIVSGVRLKYLLQFRHTQNPTYDYLAPGYWSVIELHVGIICASMPAIYSLLQSYWPKLVSGTSRGTAKPSNVMSSGNNPGSKYVARSTLAKGSRSDDFVLLTDIEIDAATMRTQSSRTPLKSG